MIRVELVEDHTLMRQGTRALLRDAADIEIVAETGQGEEALALARRLRPDVALLDIRLLPGLNGIDVARALRQDLPAIKVLILSAYPHETYVRTLFAIGVHGYLLKSASDAELAAAVRAVHRGEQWLSPEIAAQLANRTRRAVVRATETLTEREREVLELIGHGKSNRDIARTLQIETSTVESHVHNALAKLGTHSRTEALKRAVQRGVIALDLDVDNAD
jgi:RNA polymerase sigma factor (sigma-70 family)